MDIEIKLIFQWLLDGNTFSIPPSSGPHRRTFQLQNPLNPNKNYTFQIFKGTHIKTVLSARDVQFIANSTLAKAYYSWVKNMKVSAEEHHTSTLLRLQVSPRNVSVFVFHII